MALPLVLLASFLLACLLLPRLDLARAASPPLIEDLPVLSFPDPFEGRNASFSRRNLLLSSAPRIRARSPTPHGLALTRTAHQRQKQQRHAKRQQQSSGTAKAAAFPSDSQVYWDGISDWDTPLLYHGGNVLSQPITVYPIFYGSWPANSGQGIITNFIQSISSPAADSLGLSVHSWWSIVAGYSTPSGKSATSSVTLGALTTTSGKTVLYDGLVQGDPNDMLTIVSSAVRALKTKPSSTAIYLILTSGDITVTNSNDQGFCTQYCGFHGYGIVSGVQVQYAFAGVPTGCFDGCSLFSHFNAVNTPLSYPYIESMISAIAHELAETATDPGGHTFFTGSGNENGDLCNFATDGIKETTDTLAMYNVFGLRGYRYFIQALPSLNYEYCAMAP